MDNNMHQIDFETFIKDILGIEDKKEVENKDKFREQARVFKDLYDSYIEAGFNDMQAYGLVMAMFDKIELIFMEINIRENGTLQIDNARIIFRNFTGAASKFNREGDRM